MKEITVYKEPSSKFKTISEALKVATDGTKILIKPGTYEENIVIDKQVELIGSGPVDQIIVTSHRSDSAVIGVKTKKAIIRGITIHQCGEKKDNMPVAIDLPKGSAIIEYCHIVSNHGNSIVVYNSNANPIIQQCSIYESEVGEANPTVRECKIYGCKSGVAIIKKGFGRIENCQIYNNKTSNVWIKTEGDPVISGCKIHDGKQMGITVIEKGRGALMDCEIHSNEHSNICIGLEGNPEIRNCKIYNSKESGVLVLKKGIGVIEDCEIYANKLSNVEIKTEGNPKILKCKLYGSEQSGLLVSRDFR